MQKLGVNFRPHFCSKSVLSTACARMNLQSSFHIVTGAGRGIGRAISIALASRGAAGVALVDVCISEKTIEAVEAAASSAGFRPLPLIADVSTRDGVLSAIGAARSAFGRIDGMVSNAGIATLPLLDGESPRQRFTAIGESPASWQASVCGPGLCGATPDMVVCTKPPAACALPHARPISWFMRRCVRVCAPAPWQMSVNVMAHVWAAESLVPTFEQQEGGGALVSVVSAAGLLSQIGAPSYSVSKAAAVAFCQSLAIHHGDRGVRVHCVCPQAVATSLVGLPSEDPYAGDAPKEALAGGASDGVLSPGDVAMATVDAMESGEFMVLPHAGVSQYVQMKAAAPAKWVKGMRKLRDAIEKGQTPLVQS